MGRLQNPGEHLLMLEAVLGEAGEIGVLHELFFAGEVHAGEFDQALEQFGNGLAACAVDDGKTQFVHGVHEDAVWLSMAMTPTEHSLFQVRRVT